MAPLLMSDLFASELRRLRTDAGLSQEALADKIRYSASLVAAVEQGRRQARLEFAERCDTVLGGDGLLIRIREATFQESLVPWFREWAAIEQEALSLRSYQPLVLPGLLQTPAYAHALHEGRSLLTADDREQIIAGRIARQEILEREHPPLFVAVLDYTVLERPVGGAEAMREQLLHLAELAERPFIHLHVVPKEAGGYLGLAGPFVIATTPDGKEIAYLDNQFKGVAVDGTEEIRFLWHTWEAVRADALPQTHTRALILEAVRQWT